MGLRTLSAQKLCCFCESALERGGRQPRPALVHLLKRVAIRGIRLKRDNWVSVRYAEELNSATSSGILQRTDRHGILGQKSTDFQLSL
jgi:hypothetical protein